MLRKILKIVITGGMITILLTFLDVMGLIGKLHLFPITHIAFKGGAHVSLQEIQTHCQTLEGKDLLEIHLQSLRKCIERMGWVDTAHLTRTFPGTLEITLTEREPLAMAPVGGHWFYFSLGKSFLLGPAFTHSMATYPVLNQWDSWNEEKRLHALEIAKQLKKKSLSSIVSEIYFHPKKGWLIMLDRGTEIFLGDPVQMENLARLHLILERFNIASSNPRQIDLRVDKKIIVKGRNRI